MRASVKAVLRPVYRFFLSAGLDPRKVASLRHYPKYIAQYKAYKKRGGAVTHIYALLSDYDDQAGSASGHYFHQDLLIASAIHRNNPRRHIDIGSRIDGFIAHVASFRPIEVMDVRALDASSHPNISFVRADLMDRSNLQEGQADSLSCLHAIEHFGLGRYGDPLDPEGHIKGFNNLLYMLEAGGTLYISVPIGRRNEVHFNAHRVFHPKDILSWAQDRAALTLERFDYVDDAGCLHQAVDLETARLDVTFGCGIYTFRKKA